MCSLPADDVLMFAVDQETANTADIAHVQVDLVLAVTLMVLQ